MKYKVKHYPDGKILVHKEYDFVDIEIGKQPAERVEQVELSDREIKEVRKQKTPRQIRNKLDEIRGKKDSNSKKNE